MLSLKQKTLLKSLLKFETKFEYIRPVWNLYLGEFDLETFSFHPVTQVELHFEFPKNSRE